GAVTDPEIEARRDRGITVMGKFPRDFTGPFVPARHVVDDDNAGERAVALRARVIGLALVAVVPGIADHFRLQRAECHRGSPCRACGGRPLAGSGGENKADTGQRAWPNAPRFCDPGRSPNHGPPLPRLRPGLSFSRAARTKYHQGLERASARDVDAV